MLESLPGMPFSNTPDGGCDYVSAQWVEYSGVPAGALLGTGWLQLLHADDRERVAAAWRSALDRGDVFELEYRVRRRDGGYGWFKVRARPLRDEAGAVVRWLGSAIDIDAPHRAEAALREADRRKDEFLATLAHELRNPLAPLRNGLQILRHARDADTAAKVRQMMDRQLDHLVRLVDDLLDVSRISSGKVALRLQRLPLQAAAEMALEATRPSVDGGRHALALDLPAEPVWVNADPTRLAQVIANLLTNAAKYTPDGGRIELAVGRDGDSAFVRVADNGLGIPADMLSEVFVMFAQVNRTLERAQGGLGIGLALVERLVQMHGGSVVAASEGLGRGSAFTVRLPLAAASEPDDAGAAAAALGPAPLPSGLRVLVVDDHADSADSLALMLQLAGHDVTTANDGASALAAARRFAPQVVLLDIGLPGTNGYEVARAMRAEPAVERSRLVAITGWGRDDDKRRAAEAGFDVHLTKPVDAAALLQLLARIAADERR